MLGKYSGTMDIWISVFVAWCHRDKKLFCILIEHTLRSFQAMAKHLSHSLFSSLCSLSVINKGEALFFNTLGGGLDKVHVKRPLSVSDRTLNLSHGARKSLNWTAVDCLQQHGGVECGYYVMMYMHKVVSIISQNESNLQKDFNLAPYSQAKVDEMREIWCRYFIDQCV